MRNKEQDGVITVLASSENRASLSAFVASLPSWLPVPLILCMTDKSEPDETLLDRLRHGSPLPVFEVDAPTALVPGQIYANISGDALCVRDGRVFAPPARLPGSALLSSAVAAYGSETLAILLGGTSEQASEPARKVVWAGGAVFLHQVEDDPPAIVRSGIARPYRSVENLAEALGVICTRFRHAG